MIMSYNYTMNVNKSILIKTRLFKVLRKEILVINMILLIYFLKIINMISGLKMKNRLIKHHLSIYLT